jgi:hypothetical protein
MVLKYLIVCQTTSAEKAQLDSLLNVAKKKRLIGGLSAILSAVSG